MKDIKIKPLFLLLIFTFYLLNIFAAYYDNAIGTGSTLKNNLHTIISNGHSPLSYDTAKLRLFQNTFNVSSYVRCIYTGQDYYISPGYNGSTSPNTEHSFCQSWFGTSEESTKKSDLHHLFPTQSNVNSSRGNTPYGLVANHAQATTYTSYNNFHSYRGANSSGLTVFEPSDQYKGDIARGLLYFSVRYNMGLTIEGNDMLPVLIQWHQNDPVDSFEQSRNEMNYTFQGNRNPFIDHPEWVSNVWLNTNPTVNTSVFFENASFSLNEGVLTYYLSVAISDPSVTSSTQVQVVLTAGNSNRVDNFSAQTLIFPANSSGSLTIPISITDNDLIDGNETLTFSLMNVIGGNNAYAATPSGFSLTIKDNDFNDIVNDNALDLFISEYAEGLSFNKYIEIFNGTGSQVNLADYKLELYANGGTTATSIVTLSGVLENNSVKVYKNSQAILVLPVGVIAENNGAVNFNGDDALILRKISTGLPVDVFGYVGFDPGTAWTDGIYSTADKTLRRKPIVHQGVTNPASNTFPTLASEWDVYDIGSVDGFGSHQFLNNSQNNNGDYQAFLNIANNDMDYSFGNHTGINLFVNNLSGSGQIKVKRFNSQPDNPTFNGNTPGSIKPVRWIFTKDSSITSLDINLIIDLDELTSLNFTNPGQVQIYHSTTQGSGDFELLGTMSYHPENNTLTYNNINSFSEFILTTSEETLPVVLSGFNAVINSQNNSVTLNWSTQSETEMTGYFVLGTHTNNLNLADRLSGLILAHNTSNQTSYQWTDEEISQDFNYWLLALSRDGSSQTYGPVSVQFEPQTPPIDTEFQTLLKNIYPNPFNPETNICFSLSSEGYSSITIYNIKGELVKTLQKGILPKGEHTFVWKGLNNNNSKCANGVYFVRMQADGYQSMKKIMLLK